MKPFKDSKGREWEIGLTIATVKRVKGLLGIDLLDLESGDPPLLTRLATDIVLTIDAVYVCIKTQADAKNVTDEQFSEALGGDVILAARSAFFEELTDFFRQLGRMNTVKAIAMQEAIVNAAIKQTWAKLESIDPEALVAKALASPTPGESSTSTPGLSA
jgi:hypothetical protein